MEGISIGQIAGAISFIVGLIGGIIALAKYLKKGIGVVVKEEIKPIHDRLDVLENQNKDLELNADKNFLVRFLSDVEQSQIIDEVETERFYETYERYHALGGNSYIDHKVEKLKKEGKL